MRGELWLGTEVDGHFKHCWNQVLEIERQIQVGLATFFKVKNRLLYYYCHHLGKLCDLLIVSCSKINSLIHLAHYHPLGGQLGEKNTFEKIRDCFHWPGIVMEVNNFVHCCLQCQKTSPRKPALAPLILLPIIDVLFEWVGMDLLGLLPKSAQGHKYILVFMDSHLPKASPLQKAISKAVARKLVLLFSRIARSSWTRGMLFVFKLMADLCRLLQVHCLQTSVYHPQMDGLDP